MLVGYCRVSKDDMSLDRQIDSLVAAGVDERNIYQEKITGTKRERYELNRMLEGLKSGDICVVSELTRLSRSSKDLIEVAEQITAKGATIRSLKETWLNAENSAHSKLLFTIFAGLSQFERDLTAERVREGLKAAKARGRNGGRPSKRNSKEMTVRLLYDKGVKIADIVKQTDLSRSTVNRIVRDMKNESNGEK
jgi:DNA invertase Pin-like site-specific DNA recombinase